MSATAPLVEHVVTAPIVNPETGASSRTFEFLGKLDYFDDGVMTDHKIVSDPSRHIEQSTISFQPELYSIALRTTGHAIHTIGYRLMQRPLLKFKAKQTLAEYEDECVAWLTNGDGLKVIDHVLPILESRVEMARDWLWTITKRIMEAARTNKWLTNAAACWQYNRPCPFLALCKLQAQGANVEEEIAEGYERVSDVHPELDGVADGRKDALTYSAASTFALCERRYFWQYREGLRRKNYDDGEALSVGRLYHEGAAKYATEGLDAALAHVRLEASKAPIIGDEAWRKNDEMTAKVCALLRVAAMKWPATVAQNPARPEASNEQHRKSITRTSA